MLNISSRILSACLHCSAKNCTRDRLDMSLVSENADNSVYSCHSYFISQDNGKLSTSQREKVLKVIATEASCVVILMSIMAGGTGMKYVLHSTCTANANRFV